MGFEAICCLCDSVPGGSFPVGSTYLAACVPGMPSGSLSPSALDLVGLKQAYERDEALVGKERESRFAEVGGALLRLPLTRIGLHSSLAIWHRQQKLPSCNKIVHVQPRIGRLHFLNADVRTRILLKLLIVRFEHFFQHIAGLNLVT
jgi:hypothetical protein